MANCLRAGWLRWARGAWLALACTSAVACGSSPESQGGTGGSPGSGTGGGSASTGTGGAGSTTPPTGYFVMADLDGTTYTFQHGAWGGASMLEALENDSANAASWTLYYQTLPSAGPAPATINCLDNLNYVYFTAGITFSSRGTSNCNITFSAIAGSVGEIYEGTFSGTVQNSGVIRTVTNGRFRVPRTM